MYIGAILEMAWHVNNLSRRCLVTNDVSPYGVDSSISSVHVDNTGRSLQNFSSTFLLPFGRT